jgi:indolepyruvate ferredoxin oxidoreductase alpha subunit
MHSSQDDAGQPLLCQVCHDSLFRAQQPQEAYDMVQYAFDYREHREASGAHALTIRIAHSRTVVNVKGEARQENEINFNSEAKTGCAALQRPPPQRLCMRQQEQL